MDLSAPRHTRGAGIPNVTARLGWGVAPRKIWRRRTEAVEKRRRSGGEAREKRCGEARDGRCGVGAARTRLFVTRASFGLVTAD